MAHKKTGIFKRAWIEIDLDALAHNVHDIKSKIQSGCDIMAVIKADAYGHGVGRVAERLVREGISTFAVATLSEGAEVREYAPESDILVLGYTHPADAKHLVKYRLAQLASDAVHARALDETGHKISIHVAIDTGMHRLGVEPMHFSDIESIYKSRNLTVVGTATHLASPDSLAESDIEFTELQMERFITVVQRLRDKGYDVGKLHTQSSYAIYNHPDIDCDYVRPGIMLYGVHSQDDDTKVSTDLRPVLSLKALIAQVRQIDKGESVSYGRIYTAKTPIMLATVSIGYADGIPRNLTGHDGMCIVNGRKVPIIGRVCMDMLMLDVTGAGEVKAGDIATFIGKVGDIEIRCEELADCAGTITNEILCRLGARLPRIYTEKSTEEEFVRQRL
ncbi:MAG: serine racemase VanT catalytic subunit [Oscillospiraceae bacterium]|nr:serine racemase VanT catalytic subunit [Oscillospiraceae bacterium]MCL2277971.1 serine racemase VanT catalytic subunit [Oscillospiraceae bacterium]